MSSPLISVVVPTHGRPQHLREALDRIVAQDYAGPLEILVVFDRTEPDRSLETDTPGRGIRTLENERTGGLAGNRNTGILASTGELVAFCDDDDLWAPAKLTRQVEALAADPQAPLSTCGIRIAFEGELLERPVERSTIARSDLIRSRISGLHPSSFVFRREALVDRIGLVDETIPGGYAEDYELLLRTTAVGPIAHVDEPLLDVRWGRQSHYRERFDLTAGGLEWLLDRYPEFAEDRKGFARIAGQISFARMAMGQRRQGLRWLGRTVRNDPLQPRAWLALAVGAGVVSPGTVLDRLNRRGRGI